MFCEVIGDQEIFLIQSSTFYFSHSSIYRNLKPISGICCELSFCNETTVVLFESGPSGGIFVLTCSEGGNEVQEKNYLENLFEGGFVDFECKSLGEIWTLDKSGEIRLLEKGVLLGSTPTRVLNSPIISDEEDYGPGVYITGTEGQMTNFSNDDFLQDLDVGQNSMDQNDSDS